MIKYYKGMRVKVNTVLASGFMYVSYGDSHGWIRDKHLTDGFEIYLSEIEAESATTTILPK